MSEGGVSFISYSHQTIPGSYIILNDAAFPFDS